MGFFFPLLFLFVKFVLQFVFSFIKAENRSVFMLICSLIVLVPKIEIKGFWFTDYNKGLSWLLGLSWLFDSASCNPFPIFASPIPNFRNKKGRKISVPTYCGVVGGWGSIEAVSWFHALNSSYRAQKGWLYQSWTVPDVEGTSNSFLAYYRRANSWNFWDLCGTLSHGLWRLLLSWQLLLLMEE